MQQQDSQNPQTHAVPRHVAFIMDGNGRWAKARGLPRVEGHRRGSNAARDTVKAAHKRGIRYVTFFAFSAENWSRPAAEVKELMNMMRHYLKHDVEELQKYNARLHVIGDRTRLPQDIVAEIEKWEETTKDNNEIDVIMALSYGGRQELIRAVHNIAQAAQQGEISLEEIDEELISKHLMTKDIPDPDLLIRTSGEQRISNFLLWQIAYTEFYFTETAWPDFAEKELDKALESYAGRDRRYGGLPDAEPRQASGG
ncbi:MAG: isoprenyl transferase [Pseudomonadota bacterium]|nr:isoprenyl transferase [Pseudomonadota bacterium]QKK06579.1 MAG: isoprenyl transferase [Pseudomonadota bacterium]